MTQTKANPDASEVKTAAPQHNHDVRPTDAGDRRGAWSGRSDAQLVDEVRNGQIDAFGELVRRYERRLQRTLFRMVSDAEWARDLAQETFLRVFEQLDRFDTSRRFGPWLFRIGVNLAVDQFRRRRKRPVVLGGLDGVAQSADPRPTLELAEEVQLVMGQLASNDRVVLTLRDLEGFTCSEIAAILDRRESTIRWRLCKARERFRRLWEARQNANTQGVGDVRV